MSHEHPVQEQGTQRGAVRTFNYVLMAPSSGHPVRLLFFIGKIPLVHSLIYLFIQQNLTRIFRRKMAKKGERKNSLIGFHSG